MLAAMPDDDVKAELLCALPIPPTAKLCMGLPAFSSNADVFALLAPVVLEPWPDTFGHWCQCVNRHSDTLDTSATLVSIETPLTLLRHLLRHTQTLPTGNSDR